MIHGHDHLLWGLAPGIIALALALVVRNERIRKRLWFTIMAVAAFAVLHAWTMVALQPASAAAAQFVVIENLVLAFAVISLGVALLLNPWFSNRTLDRAPAIVQDAILVALLVVVAVYGVGERAWITSTAVAALIGFALQDQLSNAFAGLAIQVEKPFRVGHWITVDGHEGRVAEVTWRATKIRTKTGNVVILPNNQVAQAAISNFSEPAAPTLISVEVGAGYEVPPNDVRNAMLTAVRRVPRVLATPPPDVILNDFGDSALIYQARLWIDDFEVDFEILHDVRTAIYYEFHRRGIEIPWPISVEYQREDAPKDPAGLRAAYAGLLGGVPVFESLPTDARDALAGGATSRLFGHGEVVVREGEPGDSMFVVRTGRVVVTVGPDRREVATIDAGGYFGEMSMLTGDPRSATVTARGDCEVLEIGAREFGDWVRSNPDVVDRLAASAAERRRELDDQRAIPGAARLEPVTLAQRMRRFFRIA